MAAYLALDLSRDPVMRIEARREGHVITPEPTTSSDA